ncbi:hypothetical protein SKAU_G00394220 [Synaphobranchus kaupii]|uniref:Uncharacterized protein n=1 Tax=Synaphobranchus kaupii TaxID=118154 RepID=A0A9Q1EC38_SYNKA|nr:hypothetical protein SKAU_G00394220 [Synaphobranchus kaupii]
MHTMTLVKSHTEHCLDLRGNGVQSRTVHGGRKRAVRTGQDRTDHGGAAVPISGFQARAALFPLRGLRLH